MFAVRFGPSAPRLTRAPRNARVTEAVRPPPLALKPTFDPTAERERERVRERESTLATPHPLVLCVKERHKVW